MYDSACNPGFCLLTGRGGLGSFVLGKEAPAEISNGVQRRLRRLAVGDVLDARDQQSVDRAIALLPRDLDLAFGAVVVVLTLNDQDRYADVGEPVADVPAFEVVLHPDVG